MSAPTGPDRSGAPPTSPRVTVISGGVGAARLLSGIVQVVEPAAVTAVVNTGDDTELHGLHVSPDLDTIVYTLANAIDPERGWGLVDETWRTMAALERYVAVRPDGSAAAPTWFNLGDHDLATHFYRTARLREGADLTTVTAEIARAWGLALRVLPMTDQHFRTLIETESDGLIDFQDYFVRLRHAVPVRRIEFDHDDARLTRQARAAIVDADVVLIAPSNPLVSVGPIRALPDVDALLRARRDSVVAISPIVGGAALKGPADRMLTELGHEASVIGVASLYRDVASTLVIDRADTAWAEQVRSAGMRCEVTDTVMSAPGVAAELARTAMAAALSG